MHGNPEWQIISAVLGCRGVLTYAHLEEIRYWACGSTPLRHNVCLRFRRVVSKFLEFSQRLGHIFHCFGVRKLACALVVASPSRKLASGFKNRRIHDKQACRFQSGSKLPHSKTKGLVARLGFSGNVSESLVFALDAIQGNAILSA